MKTRITAAVMTIIVALSLSAGITAHAEDWTYKNPANPSKNVKKLKDSQYRGWHYEKKWEPYRKCIMARESGGNYKVDGKWGSGAYQFIQSTWDEAMKKARMPEWIGVRPHKAPPAYQDEAFWIMANPYPKKPGLHGRHHWSSKHAASFGFKTHDC